MQITEFARIAQIYAVRVSDFVRQPSFALNSLARARLYGLGKSLSPCITSLSLSATRGTDSRFRSPEREGFFTPARGTAVVYGWPRLYARQFKRSLGIESLTKMPVPVTATPAKPSSLRKSLLFGSLIKLRRFTSTAAPYLCSRLVRWMPALKERLPELPVTRKLRPCVPPPPISGAALAFGLPPWTSARRAFSTALAFLKSFDCGLDVFVFKDFLR